MRLGISHLESHDSIRQPPSSMKLVIQTFPPLPECKFWFQPDVENPPVAIGDLKEALSHDINLATNSNFVGHHLRLFFNDIELFSHTLFSIVDNDSLLHVKAASESPVGGVKAEGLSGVSFGMSSFRILNILVLI